MWMVVWIVLVIVVWWTVWLVSSDMSHMVVAKFVIVMDRYELR